MSGRNAMWFEQDYGSQCYQLCCCAWMLNSQLLMHMHAHAVPAVHFLKCKLFGRQHQSASPSCPAQTAQQIAGVAGLWTCAGRSASLCVSDHVSSCHRRVLPCRPFAKFLAGMLALLSGCTCTHEHRRSGPAVRAAAAAQCSRLGPSQAHRQTEQESAAECNPATARRS